MQYPSIRPPIQMINGKVETIPTDSVLIEDIILSHSKENIPQVRVFAYPVYANQNALTYSIDYTDRGFAIDKNGLIDIGDYGCGLKTTVTMTTTDGSNITKTQQRYFWAPC